MESMSGEAGVSVRGDFTHPRIHASTHLRGEKLFEPSSRPGVAW